ncbi:hypothetical protein TWF718_004049 [Orbilia javanica]|uniref:Uncharacterized protein n=1 Tax=Orbilia javanica TaxID=47235 RepID=A0AAN8MX29_9PEZI
MPKFRKLIKKLLLSSKPRKRLSLPAALGSPSAKPRLLENTSEVFYDPNPYNFFLLCPKHAEPGFIEEIYEDEMTHLQCLLKDKPHPGLTSGLARGELARRTTLTTDMKDKIQRRMDELDAAKSTLVDPKRRPIVDERYGGRTKCQICAEPEATGIAPYDESGSALMSHPRPCSREWRKSTGIGDSFDSRVAMSNYNRAYKDAATQMASN